MANPRNPDDATRSNLADDPYRTSDTYHASDVDRIGDSGRTSDPYRPADPYRASDPTRASDLRDPARLDDELQADPELAEGPASGGKIAMFAVAVVLILGAVFYGLNNSSMEHAGTTPTAQNTARTAPPAAPPGMRDVTPRANTDQGVTTGAAPARPAPPPAAAPPDNAPNK
jgi:hypothetical protein